MLTHNDLTVLNAAEIFDQCKNSKAQYWGVKEEPLPLEEMKKLFSYMKACGKTTFLEVVAYSEEEGLEGAKLAHECCCDILMGTIFSDKINKFYQENKMKYMPFLGNITGRPSVLEGSIDSFIDEANQYLAKGVFGFDLLGYRYTGDAKLLNKTVVESVDAPVCLAGSVDSFEKLDHIKEIKPWAFTIGSAFFEKKFGDDFAEQIDIVCDYMAN